MKGTIPIQVAIYGKFFGPAKVLKMVIFVCILIKYYVCFDKILSGIIKYV